jgi:DmsE family decaheme c-type cytochrome
MRGLRAGLILGSFALASFLLGSGTRADTPAPQDVFSTPDVDFTQCSSCHEATVKGMRGTPHSSVAGQCASCHGDVAGHLASVTTSGEKGPITSLKDMKPRGVNETCLTCHSEGHAADWTGSVHERRGVSCTNCHSVHHPKSEKAQLKTARDADTCYSCHTNVRAKSMRVSHHPVREGLMGCGSCHDPHGTQEKLLKADSVNEQCYSCHMEKRGPFLWEHAPVRENCANCHDPHGSNHEKLLVAKQPYLCQRCHLNTRHPGTLYDARNSLLGPSTSNRLIEHSCRNCHQSIHGTNAPSGPYLGR